MIVPLPDSNRIQGPFESVWVHPSLLEYLADSVRKGDVPLPKDSTADLLQRKQLAWSSKPTEQHQNKNGATSNECLTSSLLEYDDDDV
jgi:hypothetical protein